jgi:hypothetical protein
MKTAVSIPDPIFRKADKAAKDLGVSRSGLYALALEEYLKSRRPMRVTEKLNEVYADLKSGIDPGFLAMQGKSVGREKG